MTPGDVPQEWVETAGRAIFLRTHEGMAARVGGEFAPDALEAAWASFDAASRQQWESPARITLATLIPTIRASALNNAADAIQALHPGEVKNSVTFLRDLARKELEK